MTKRDKLRRKLRNNPVGRTQQDIETILGHYGFTLDHVTGSHHVYVLDTKSGKQRLIVPLHGQKVKPAYVRLVLEKLDELFPLDEQRDSSNEDSDE